MVERFGSTSTPRRDRGEAFPQEYRHDAFVAMHGSWNRRPPAGYEIVRVSFDGEGKPQKIEPFVTGFLFRDGEQWAWFGRPAGIVEGKDGSLLFSDDENGVIYRVSYTGEGAQPARGTPAR